MDMQSTGMNLRDYFAAKAIQSLPQSAHYMKETLKWCSLEGGSIEDALAETAYDIADAMIAFRERNT